MRSSRSAASERTSLTAHGPKMIPSTTAATSTARMTSRAAVRACVAERKTMPAAITSAAPTPLRERTSVRSRRSSSGAGAGSGTCTGVGRSDWRQSIPAPAASSTTGQTMTSENQIPSARIVSRKARVTRPIPTATSMAPRPRGRRRAQVLVVPGALSSTGTSTQARP